MILIVDYLSVIAGDEFVKNNNLILGMPADHASLFLEKKVAHLILLQLLDNQLICFIPFRLLSMTDFSRLALPFPQVPPLSIFLFRQVGLTSKLLLADFMRTDDLDLLFHEAIELRNADCDP